MPSPTATVLGVGNPIMGDDGVGLEILAGLHAHLAGQPDPDPLAWVPSRAPADPLPEQLGGTRLVHGGTAGLELLAEVEQAESLLLLDAVAARGHPGAVVVLHGDQVPRLLAATLSPHQVGLLDVLSAARLLGREPRRLAVVGIIPADTSLHVGLSTSVAAGVPAAVAAAADVLAEWGAAEVPLSPPAG